ncbi:prolyl oligopeptidase family serine peptidase [Parabacteroides sp. PF5-9]|uniref:S9 family peptidase n=1 Tax=Parabacteroides sp. PF5-9 TaxID=1742404 RepID=UPI002476733C|nr:prolyl oligopeptidase family serine peptidase [Parabacteroides sp. PF5-9]MDH6358861.1 dipeptidyl aminopeptidase/acylaminoacyl peptidase [Parabacteroides sp. PF5-9]
MKYLKLFFVLFSLIALFSIPVFAQRSMTFEDLRGWKRISEQAVSENGKWVAIKSEPWVGDPMVRLFNAEGGEVAVFTPADKFVFSSSSDYLLLTLTPGKEVLDSLKLIKEKPEKMEMNRLVIYGVKGQKETVDSIKTYQLSEKVDWLAYQSGRKDSTLHVRTLDGNQTFQIQSVSAFGFAKDGEKLFFVSDGDGQGLKPGVYLFDLIRGGYELIKEGEGMFKAVSFDEKGDFLSFVYCEDKDSAYKSFDLWLSEYGRPAMLIADRNHSSLPKGWVLSEDTKISFSKNGSYLFFGTSPEPKQKDTTTLAEYRPDVQVWNWNEPVQYTVQVYNRESDLKKNYQAVYHLKDRSLFQLANEEIPTIQLADEGTASVALLSSSRSYSLSSMWEGRTRQDYYIVSLENGERTLLKEAEYGRMRLSPEGKYAWWYSEMDSSWYTIDIKDKKEYRLTTPATFLAWDEENDVPDYPGAHGVAGWTKGDNHLLIYDRYDIWKFDPKGVSAPVNLTKNGRESKVVYRFIQLDKESKSIDMEQVQLLRGFNEASKGYGYYSTQFSKPAIPKTLLSGDFMLRMPIKAKSANTLIYSMESFEKYPEIYLTDLSFKKSVQLTHEGKQQEGLIWGTAELTSWLSLDGKHLEGVIYKPSNFDPQKKYPVIVNFYERNAETLYNYHMPEPHRSTIDYHFYTSNGYIVFNPDVIYEDGYPGESCYNSVMPGIMHLIAKGYIDEKAIGAQGHSWGGYQVAYLATRTNLFAAIESGAPVVNMFSAYGGIRWGSGLNRSFQYEHGQSRIGGTPWSTPLRYVENSPLFTMDKVETPILIMHNDQDGHVPWYQGIEYFVALKRLQKPVWMLNYTGEPHWPLKIANKIDFQKRMYQFFEHYLRSKPMPVWMKDGVRAVDQPFELGY